MIIDLGYRKVVRPIMFRAYAGDAEQIHEQTLTMINTLGRNRRGTGRGRRPLRPAPQIRRWSPGIQFPGVIGLAAGMDKNGVGVRAWGSLGFGHAELGTVTAQPQPGNEKPRLFRLAASEAVINRMGFNNLGARALADRLAAAGVARGNQAVGHPARHLHRQDQDHPAGGGG